jgi:hypothetical protein
LPIFWQKYFKNHNIGPRGQRCSKTLEHNDYLEFLSKNMLLILAGKNVLAYHTPVCRLGYKGQSPTKRFSLWIRDFHTLLCILFIPGYKISYLIECILFYYPGTKFRFPTHNCRSTELVPRDPQI